MTIKHQTNTTPVDVFMARTTARPDYWHAAWRAHQVEQGTPNTLRPNALHDDAVQPSELWHRD